MDDTDVMDRVATNNPALTASALREPFSRRRSSGKSRQTPNAADDSSSASNSVPQLSKYDVGWRRVVRNFSPSWFSVTVSKSVL
jgi:hypothetical protein